MIKSYFKTAWRNLLRNKFYSAINITGLAAGLAVGIMILLWVQDEFSYDSFHANAANIYKANAHLGKGNDASVWEGVPAPIAVFCKQSIPEVVNSVRIDNVNVKMELCYKDKKFYGSKIGCVDLTFFSVFHFKLLQGNPAKPFPYMNSIIISASEARKIFGDENVVGKVLATDLGKIPGTDLYCTCINCVPCCYTNSMDIHEQMVAKLCVPDKYKLVDIFYSGLHGNPDHIIKGKFSINKSSNNKPSEEFENGIEQL